jgi:hypothetical protein
MFMKNLNAIRQQFDVCLLAVLLLLCAGNQARAQTNTTAIQPPSAPGCAVPDANGDFQRMLLAELRRLRVDLLEYRIELQTARTAALQLTLEQVRARQSRLSDEERAAVQQLNTQEPQFSAQTLTPGERSQLESMRAALSAEQEEGTRAERSDLAIRESAADTDLRAAQQRLHDLQGALRELTARR